MKILFLLRLWPVYGGGEAVTLRLANEFCSLGLDVYIAYFKYSDYGLQSTINNNITAIKINNIHCDEYSADESDANRVSEALSNIINKNKIDFVLNIWHPLSYIKDLKNSTKAKIIWCRHCTFAIKPDIPYSRRLRIINKIFPRIKTLPNISEARLDVNLSLPYVDGYVFLSKEYIKQYICSNAEKSNIAKLFAIPNPLMFDESISEEELKKKEDIVLIVSRLEESSKKISRAIRVWKAIENNNDEVLSNWKLYIVGDGSSMDEYKKLSQELNLQRIFFEGYQYPISYYKKSKILLMTSNNEGFPMSILEGQQFGVVPIVMDSTPALKDLINNKTNGFIIKDGDEQSMYRMLIRLIREGDSILDYSNDCLRTSAYFNIKNVASMWMSFFFELSNTHTNNLI